MGALSERDNKYLKRAIELALEAEQYGNMPIGAVIAFSEGQIVAEGRNAVIEPFYNPGRHAEMEAFRKAPERLWEDAGRMTLYTSLEPCIMCFGAALLHGIRRVVFGAADPEGGASQLLGQLPRYYNGVEVELIGPGASDECDPLYIRARDRFAQLPCA